MYMYFYFPRISIQCKLQKPLSDVHHIQFTSVKFCNAGQISLLGYPSRGMYVCALVDGAGKAGCQGICPSYVKKNVVLGCIFDVVLPILRRTAMRLHKQSGGVSCNALLCFNFLLAFSFEVSSRILQQIVAS